MRFAVPLAVLLGMILPVCPALAHQQNLEGTEWGVVGDRGDGARSVSFAGSNRIFGFGGCNRFSGTFAQRDTNLTISPEVTSQKACAPDVMAKEDEFLAMLAKVRSVQVDQTLILLLDEAGSDLRTILRRDPD